METTQSASIRVGGPGMVTASRHTAALIDTLTCRFERPIIVEVPAGASCKNGPMWVRLAEWMIGENPDIRVGCLFTDIGLRLRGVVAPARPDAPDGVVEVRAGRPHETIYGLTGRVVGAPRDVDTSTSHVGVEFAVMVGAGQYQVQTEGWVEDVATGSRIHADGRLEVVDDHEFDAFQLVDSRTDWLVKNIEPLGNGDLMIDLTAPPAG